MSTVLDSVNILQALSKSELKDGNLYISGMTKSGTKNFAKVLRNAILDYRIPFYKPVAISVSGIGLNSDVLTMIKGMNGCLADLFISAESICFAEGSITESEAKWLKPRRGSRTSDFCVISNDNRGIITSSDSWVISGAGTPVKSMVLDKPFVKTSGANVISISMICERTSQRVSHEGSIQIISKKTDTLYVPMDAVYSLDDHVLIDLENVEAGVIHMLYRNKIDETVLHSILKKYGEEVGTGLWD